MIDLVGIQADKYTYAKGKLTLTESGGKVAVLSVTGTYGKRDFQLTPDATGGTYVMLTGRSDRVPLAASLGQGPPPFWIAGG